MTGIARTTLALAATAAVLLLGGCTGGGDDGSRVATAGGAGDSTATTAGEGEPVAGRAAQDDEERRRQFTACLREHGVDIPDPEPGAGGRAAAADGIDKAAMRAAMQACREFMPNGGEREQPSPADLERLRQLAQCLREQGLDVSDPDPNSGGLAIPKGAGGQPAAGEQELERAMQACRQFDPKGGGTK